jgi:hypothetical protein
MALIYSINPVFVFKFEEIKVIVDFRVSLILFVDDYVPKSTKNSFQIELQKFHIFG